MPVLFFKQKTAYEMRISDWSSDVCSSDLPQAIQKIAPPLAGQLISLIKDSSIVSLISVQELTFSGTEIANSSGLVYETWITIAVLYFLLCFLLSRLFGRYEAQIGRASCRERVCQYV